MYSKEEILLAQKEVNISNVINHKRIMLANLRTGQHIFYLVTVKGQPSWVEAEIVRIEIKNNFGRLWTTWGQLPWESLTSKYKVVQV